MDVACLVVRVGKLWLNRVVPVIRATLTTADVSGA